MAEKTAVPFSCPLCGGTASEPDVLTRADGTSNEGWLRCSKCRRYVVSTRPGVPFVPTYAKPHR
jgi:transcription elongation factor Elf1